MDNAERQARLDRMAESGLPIPLDKWNEMGRPGDPEQYRPMAHLPLNQRICECDDSAHWLEDQYGQETRIVCGCSCAECASY